MLLRPFKGEQKDSAFLLSAAAAWLLSAAWLVLVCALVLHHMAAGERILAYVSSAVSFLAAVAAGAAAAGKRREGRLYAAIFSAAVIVTALLTVGFMIRGSRMDPSAVLSVVSFSFAGCLTGAMLQRGKRKKKQYPNP